MIQNWFIFIMVTDTTNKFVVREVQMCLPLARTHCQLYSAQFLQLKEILQ